MRFNGEPILINYSKKLTHEERDLLGKTYNIHDLYEINYECRGWDNKKKSIYIQCADWVRLIPKDLINSERLIINLPRHLPLFVSVYMVTELSALSGGRLPKILEYRDESLNRIIDLNYESFMTKKKQGTSLYN